jgi:putative ABC transport system permease protein
MASCGLSGLSGFMPQTYVALEDLTSAGLLGPGARATYRLYIAGEPAALAKWDAWLSGYQAAHPEVDDWQVINPNALENDLGKTLENALLFLDLAALATLMIGGLSILISSRLQLTRWIKSLQLMRAMGASASQIRGVLSAQIIGLGVIWATLGLLLGLLVFVAMIPLLKKFLGEFTVQWGLSTMFSAWVMTLVTLISFTLVAFWQSQLQTLRGDLRGSVITLKGSWQALGVGYLTLLMLTYWQVSLSIWLGLAGVLSLLVVLLAGLAQLWVSLLARLQTQTRGLVRLSIAQLILQKDLLRLQIIALGGIGFLLLLMSQVKDQLIETWQSSLSPDTPTVFVTNIETFELPELLPVLQTQTEQLSWVGILRGRLTQVNGQSFSGAQFPPGRLRNLANREGNIALMAQLPAHNPIIETWQGSRLADAWPLSIESGIAKDFGLKLGDTLTFWVNGQALTAQIVSLRKVSWESLKLNFFFILQSDKHDFSQATPTQNQGNLSGVLSEDTQQNWAVSYLANFYKPSATSAPLQNQLRQIAPGSLYIDLSKQLAEVRKLMDQAARGLMVIFYLALLASILVVFSAIEATSRARWQGWWLLKVYGAPIKAIRRLAYYEFLFLGLLAGSLASLLAQLAAQILGAQLLDLSLGFSLTLWLAGIGGMMLLVWGISAWHLEKSLRLSPHALAQKIKGAA